MPQLRILHVVPYYEQAWAYGGIPRLATTLTRTLARRGHAVTVCTTDACDADARLPVASPVASGFSRTSGVDVRVFPNVSNRLAYHAQVFTPIGLSRFLGRECRRGAFDVAHIHACHNLPGVIAARALSRSGIPYVVSPNGTAIPIERRILAKRVFAATAGRRLLADAAAVLAVSEAERLQLARLVTSSRLHIVPNPIDDDEYAAPPDGATFRGAHGLGRAPVVLFLGKLTARKGVDVLVRACARLERPGLRLVIAGNDMGAGHAIERAIRDTNQAARVVRTGLLTGRTRLEALAAADVVVYPSRDEVFGLVPIESLLCGTPVVVGDDHGCGEIVAHLGGGLRVAHGDVNALAGAIEAILDAPDEWINRVRTAAARARATFGADAVCDRLERLYLDLTTPRAVTPADKPVGVSF